MTARIAEHTVRARRFGPAVRYRVDLHGVSVFGPGRHHDAIRWEWIAEISVGDGVLVRSANAEVRLPEGSFGLSAESLAERLSVARAIEHRTDVISELSSPPGGG